MSALAVEGLSKQFGKKIRAVEDVSFTLRPGRITALAAT